MVEKYPIGKTVYIVHKTYAKTSISGGIIHVCKVKTYQNIDGEIIPIVRIIGSKQEPSLKTHNIYTDIEKAVKAISVKKSNKDSRTEDYTSTGPT